MRIKHKTKRLPSRYRALVEGKFPNAGPNPSIRGMKEKFYGLDSYCVLCGKFLYNLGVTLRSDTLQIWSLAK